MARSSAPADGHPGFRTQPEECDDTRLAVEGTVPGWLRGRYLVNGPGGFEAGATPFDHWFDAFAMLRRLRFDDDGIAYANRFVRSDDYTYAQTHGGVRTTQVGTVADRPPWTRLRQALTGAFPDNPSIGVVRHGDDYLAVTETPWGLQVDPETLATTGRVDLTDGLDCDVTLGHPHYDAAEDTFYNLGISYERAGRFTLFTRPGSGGAPTPLTRLQFGDAPYVHSFALTAEYAVVTVNPVGLNFPQLLAGTLTGATFADAMEALDQPLRFVVLDRTTGAHVTTVAAPPAFVYHHANAYATDDELVVDLVAYPDADARPLTALTLANLRRGADLPAGDLVRYRLPLAGGTATRDRLQAGPVEFPTINYRAVNGQPYRYCYLAATEGGASLPTALTKVDVETGPVRRWRDTGTHPGEAVFVPRPDGDSEDDGVLLSVVLDPDADRSLVVVLDAATLTERARAPLPHRLPYGFHGQFYGPDSPGRSVA